MRKYQTLVHGLMEHQRVTKIGPNHDSLGYSLSPLFFAFDMLNQLGIGTDRQILAA